MQIFRKNYVWFFFFQGKSLVWNWDRWQISQPSNWVFDFIEFSPEKIKIESFALRQGIVWISSIYNWFIFWADENFWAQFLSLPRSISTFESKINSAKRWLTASVGSKSVWLSAAGQSKWQELVQLFICQKMIILNFWKSKKTSKFSLFWEFESFFLMIPNRVWKFIKREVLDDKTLLFGATFFTCDLIYKRIVLKRLTKINNERNFFSKQKTITSRWEFKKQKDKWIISWNKIFCAIWNCWKSVCKLEIKFIPTRIGTEVFRSSFFFSSQNSNFQEAHFWI